MEELKPCPKRNCRSSAILLHIPGWGLTIACESCGHKITGYVREGWLIKKWNRRAKE